ncbi:hypothetical protein CLOM_g12643 [Closterium sp. NIES-68]|nr:hypothetical protein CLOM_g12643 [Closterium sp. NIES-68]
MASASSQAGYLAKQGLSLLYSATVTGVNAVSTGISMAYKHCADLHEREKIESMRKAGKRPEDVIVAALQRLLHLEMAGYHHEVAAVSQKIATKLGTADDRSSVEHQTLQALSQTLIEACRQHGMDVTSSVKGGRLGFQGLEDFLNSSRMGTDHYDRDKLVTDLYFAFLFAQDDAQGSMQRIEAAINEAVERLISGPTRDCLSPLSPLSPSSADHLSPCKSGGGFSSGCVRAASVNDLPAYARPDAFKLPQAPPSATSYSSSSSRGGASSSSSGSKWGASASSVSRKAGNKPSPVVATGTDDDKTSDGLMVLKRLACCMARAAAEAEARRQRGLQDAQEVVRREQEKASRSVAMAEGTSGGVPMGGGRPIPSAQGGHSAAGGAWGTASANSAFSGGAPGVAGARSVAGPSAGSSAAAVSNWKGGNCSAMPVDAAVGAYNRGMVTGGAGGYVASGGAGKGSGGGWGGKSGGGW